MFSQTIEGSIWIKEIIAQKIKNQMGLVFRIAKKTGKEGPFINRLKEKFSRYLFKISQSNNSDALELANRLRGWEANASKLYFRALSYNLPGEFQFEKRSKRPALDPFNATLNYCYGILYNKIEGMMIRAGLDPHIGIFHKDQYNRPVLVFDVIELFRHWAEYPVMEAFINKILQNQHYHIRKDKVFITSHGRKIIIELFFAYLNERIKWEDERTKRILHIKNYIENFATKMKNYKPDDVKTSGI
jgi:CRISPR-associated protein Cas1